MVAARGGEGARHGGDRRRAQHRARRLAFRQRVGAPSWCAPARSTRFASRLRAGEPGRGGVPLRRPRPASRCREAVALVTADPARMAGLGGSRPDRAGLRADLVRVRVHDGLPVVRQVWRAGRAASIVSIGARVAVYYAPEPDDPLWRAGCAWLGPRPGQQRAALPQPDLPDIAASPPTRARYGFHATLKPPMRLATELRTAFLADAARACRTASRRSTCRRSRSPTSRASSRCARPRRVPRCRRSPMPASSGLDASPRAAADGGTRAPPPARPVAGARGDAAPLGLSRTCSRPGAST